MAVYVDDMQMPARVGRLTANWSHLMADSRDELIEFGARIGMQRRWLQNKRSGVHFDLTDPKRDAAIRLGAIPIECGSEQWSRVVDEARQQYDGPDKRPRRFPMPTPDYTLGGLFADPEVEDPRQMTRAEWVCPVCKRTLTMPLSIVTTSTPTPDIENYFRVFAYIAPESRSNNQTHGCRPAPSGEAAEPTTTDRGE